MNGGDIQFTKPEAPVAETPLAGATAGAGGGARSAASPEPISPVVDPAPMAATQANEGAGIARRDDRGTPQPSPADRPLPGPSTFIPCGSDLDPRRMMHPHGSAQERELCVGFLNAQADGCERQGFNTAARQLRISSDSIGKGLHA